MDSLQKINLLLDNPQFSTVSSLILALYAGMAAPALPNSVILFFDTIPGKVLFLFLIGFMASRNSQVALMLAVAFVVTLHVVNQRTTEQYINFIAREKFMGSEEHPLSENYISDDQTEQFRNYRLEGFVGEDEDDDDDDVEGDAEVDVGDEDGDEGDDEVGDEDDVEGEDRDTEEQFEEETIEEFYSPVQSSNDFSSVKPAHNLNGNSREMFAPVKFN